MIVPIFPLPNVVLFPKTMLPLHIFEERYKVMIREVISGDGRMVIVLLEEGWEPDAGKNPAVHKIACLGQIETYEELDEGKYNIVLAGLQRVRIVREIEHTPYRLAEVEVLEELPFDERNEEVIQQRNRLGSLFTRFAELATTGNRRVTDMVLQLDFEALVNMAATTLNLPPEERQAFLEIDNILSRCDALMPILQRHLETLILIRRFEHIKPAEPQWN